MDNHKNDFFNYIAYRDLQLMRKQSLLVMVLSCVVSCLSIVAVLFQLMQWYTLKKEYAVIIRQKRLFDQMVAQKNRLTEQAEQYNLRTKKMVARIYKLSLYDTLLKLVIQEANNVTLLSWGLSNKKIYLTIRTADAHYDRYIQSLTESKQITDLLVLNFKRQDSYVIAMLQGSCAT